MRSARGKTGVSYLKNVEDQKPETFLEPISIDRDELKGDGIESSQPWKEIQSGNLLAGKKGPEARETALKNSPSTRGPIKRGTIN